MSNIISASVFKHVCIMYTGLLQPLCPEEGFQSFKLHMVTLEELQRSKFKADRSLDRTISCTFHKSGKKKAVSKV